MGDGIGGSSDGRIYLEQRVAVVGVRLGETNQEAWLRHLGRYPEDQGAMTKIFHHAEPLTEKTDSRGKSGGRRSFRSCP